MSFSPDRWALEKIDTLVKYVHENWGIDRSSWIIMTYFAWVIMSMAVNATQATGYTEPANWVWLGICYAVVGSCVYFDAWMFRKSPKESNARTAMFRTTVFAVGLRYFIIGSVIASFLTPVLRGVNIERIILVYLEELVYMVFFYTIYAIGPEDPPGKKFREHLKERLTKRVLVPIRNR